MAAKIKIPPMPTDASPHQPIMDALAIEQGNLVAAAQRLFISPITLDRKIRSSAELQAFVSNIDKVVCSADYDRLSTEQFDSEITRLQRAYKLESLEIIHNLATMEYGESAAMAEVKLKAAIQLKMGDENSPKQSGNSSVLEELNQLYQQSAPRIKSIRLAQIEFKE